MNSLKLQSFHVLLRFFCLSLFIEPSFQGLSQIQFEKIQGVVIDSTTAQPIPQVSIWTNHSSTISEADGNFSLAVLTGDTIHFSHISYHELAMQFDPKLNHSGISISLRQKIRLLDEVKVYSYLSEGALRQKIMETTPVLSKEEEIAKINSKIITCLARYVPPYPMNAHDNYIDYMQGSQGVVIFSSKPSKGLIRAIKNVINPNPRTKGFSVR